MRNLKSRGTSAGLLPLLFCSAAFCAQETAPKPATPAPKPAVTTPAKPAVIPPKPGTTTPTQTPAVTTPAGAAAAARAAVPIKTPTPAVKPPTPAVAPPVAKPVSVPLTPTSVNKPGVVRPNLPGIKDNRLPNGTVVRRDPGGRVAGINRGPMNIYRNRNGAREIRVDRPNGSRIVVERGNRGYVENRYAYGGRAMAYRTYYSPRGVPYQRFYRPYNYGSVPVAVYAPRAYYAPGFYSYAYAPYASPIPYAWGWAGSGPAVYFGPYYTPYSNYPAPSYWLTDYTLSTTLAQSYQAQLDAANGVPPQPVVSAAPISPEVKQQIAEEVRRQVILEYNEGQQTARNQEVNPASSGVERMLRENTADVLIAGADLDVADAGGRVCSLSPGDVVKIGPPPPPGSPVANVVVLASKPQDCAGGSTVGVGVADLQEMQNHLRDSIHEGMGVMQAKAGTGGLPPVPPAARGASTDAPFAALAPPPDMNAGAEIAEQVREADNAEREAIGSSTQEPERPYLGQPASVAPYAPPVTAEVHEGDTTDQVRSILGVPQNTLVLGNSTVYTYAGRSIVFREGKVIDIQIK